MAVFQGARLHTTALPDRAFEGRVRAGDRARSVARPVVGAVPRLRPTGLLMAGILAATMLGFAYLTQTLGSNATSVELTELSVRHDEIWLKLRSQEAIVRQWAVDPELATRARRLGLRQVGQVVELKAP